MGSGIGKVDEYTDLVQKAVRLNKFVQCFMYETQIHDGCGFLDSDAIKDIERHLSTALGNVDSAMRIFDKARMRSIE